MNIPQATIDKCWQLTIAACVQLVGKLGVGQVFDASTFVSLIPQVIGIVEAAGAGLLGGDKKQLVINLLNRALNELPCFNNATVQLVKTTIQAHLSTIIDEFVSVANGSLKPYFAKAEAKGKACWTGFQKKL